MADRPIGTERGDLMLFWRTVSNSGVIHVLVALLVGLPSLADAAEEAQKKNGLEFFVGGTFDDGSGDPSIGATYERRFGGDLGLGFTLERTEGREWVLGIPFFVHFNEHWKGLAMVGTEELDGDYEMLVRLGASYEFDMGGWSLAPELNFDFVDKDVKMVIGVSFGFEF
jgi:hypothetical protein